MAYGDQTTHYGIPIPDDGEPITSEDERTAATIIENQIRAGILGAGGNRVYREGSYSVQVNTTNQTTVVLLGNPSVQGICNEGLVESFDAIVWNGLLPSTTYFLYLRATSETYRFPDSFETIASASILTGDEYLLLAKIDTTGATPSTPPTVNTTPAEKASAFNLFELVNSNQDPFGPALTQTALTILSRLTVYLDDNETALFSQLNADATLPVISIENFSSQPEIRSGQELRFADSRLVDGIALTDSANPEFLGAAASIIGALNEILSTLINHLNDSTDPHGETLNQTNLVISNYLQLPRLDITPPVVGGPPGPPGPPSPPGPPVIDQAYEIGSNSRLRFRDARGSIDLTEDGQSEYDGEATSLIGALNELFGLIVALTAEINAINGQTVNAMSPIVLEINPDEVGTSLHFRIQISEDDSFGTLVLEKDSSVSASNWYYERHIRSPSLPPASPPSPPVARSPHSPLPFFEVPELTEPVWSPLPSSGLAEDLQLRPDGDPVKVQYRIQPDDALFLRRRYSLRVQQKNLEYGEFAIGKLVLG